MIHSNAKIAQGVTLKPTTEKCEGCTNVVAEGEEKHCRIYRDPAFMWRDDSCRMATHLVRKAETTDAKINPLKASKRASRGK